MIDIVAVMAVAGSFTLGWYLCSRTQRNRLDSAAVTLESARAVQGLTEDAVMVATKYTDRIVADSKAEAALAGRVAALIEAYERSADLHQGLAKTIEAMDRTVGNMLKALVVTGVVRTANTTPSTRDRMVGEPSDDLPIGATTEMR